MIDVIRFLSTIICCFIGAVNISSAIKMYSIGNYFGCGLNCMVAIVQAAFIFKWVMNE